MRNCTSRMNLQTLLHQTFGFPAFRANQEAVCRAATDGRDVLLVMPTGAGKSLCYQLPAIARGGTALVISPLIALMDDQASKLTAAGLRVARIHSGLSREDSRQACRDYLDGTLQFLFIAPERMRVPGFPEMLAKRKPALIAIDEAHCISAWGHDFRPDYRTLGDYLPALRPAPILALTATATPTVQQDIITQLQLHNPERFIHGFRRHNLAIEVVELSKPRRHEFTAKLLKEKANRPAIVYAPSRKSAEELASVLGGSAAPYHAGLDPATRERVQRHFLSGKLEVVVATIAFGMGIDKADVRTVVHTALPGSVEAYYQEIGRAGRDGLPSRTVLLHSFADRKMHDFFLERDYPAPTELSRVATVLTGEFQMPDLLRQRIKMDAESFDRAISKLVAAGAASIDIAGNVRSTGVTNWRSGYDQQLAFRRSQIDRIVQFAETQQCRMAALINHFGDTADGLRPCGVCDFCSPERATAQPFRAPTQQEDRHLRAILRTLDGAAPRGTGKLHTDLALGIDRKQFDTYLNALARAGLITLTTDNFTNPEGRDITFKRAALTHEGRTRDEAHDLAALLRDSTESPSKSSKTAGSRASGTNPRALGTNPRASRAASDDSSATYTPNQKDLQARLIEWRQSEAKKAGIPTFFILSASLLNSIVLTRPTTISALLQISGIGPEKSDRYGAAIIALCTSQPIPGDYGTPIPAAKPTSSSPTKKARVPHPSQSHREGWDRESQSPQPPISTPTLKRPSNHSDPTANLTPDQQQLDHLLREWRKSEAEKLGLPQFFVFGSSALRSIVLHRPRTLTQLRAIPGIAPEKIEKYGASILEVCNT
jgi:ATP-dependent DNA helicase RecQ